jgi:hypothetical protein
VAQARKRMNEVRVKRNLSTSGGVNKDRRSSSCTLEPDDAVVKVLSRPRLSRSGASKAREPVSGCRQSSDFDDNAGWRRVNWTAEKGLVCDWSFDCNLARFSQTRAQARVQSRPASVRTGSLARRGQWAYEFRLACGPAHSWVPRSGQQHSEPHSPR